MKLVLWLLSVLSVSLCNESFIPRPQEYLRVSGIKIVPKQISESAIKQVLIEHEEKQTTKELAEFYYLFRRYTKLPENYGTLLSNDSVPKRWYSFKFGEWSSFNIEIDTVTRVIRKAYHRTSSIGASGDSLKVFKRITDKSYYDPNEIASVISNYFTLEQRRSIENYDLSLSTFGESSVIVSCRVLGMSPPSFSKFFVNLDIGHVQEFSLESVATMYSRECRAPQTDQERLELAHHVIGYSGTDGPSRIISCSSDIPDYEMSTLDKDIENALCEPYTTSSKRHPVVYIYYTYNQGGGYVHRYRIPFDNDGDIDGSNIKKMELGEGIGKPYYLQ